jgi:hypothetical protein
MNLCLKAAYAYIEAGLSVLPAGQDKRPVASWKDRQVTIPCQNQVTVDFNGGALLGIICGKVSGNLEVMDFDKSGRDYDKWAEKVEEEVPGLIERLVKQQTQSGGYHIAFRCSQITIPGNQKLATDPDGSVSIETRGEGGYILAYPSNGYDIKQGRFSRLPDITPSERAALLLTAKLLNKKDSGPVQYRAPVIPRESQGDAPGDDFNARGDVAALLEKHGWVQTRSVATVQGGGYHWRRPGKRDGQSATLFANNHFYIFSSNAAPFDSDRVYDPFGVYTILEHSGDFRTAAKALGAQGYGK